MHDVAPGTTGDLEFCRMEESVRERLKSGEACYPRVKTCSDRGHQALRLPAANALLSAVHLAFAKHLPLVLSPDMIWLAIAQGFAQHINNHPEELRRKFVSFEGMGAIIIQRDDFDPHAADAPWPLVFDNFAEGVRRFVGPIADTLVADFSTTGPVERAASQVVLMGAFKPYFQYVLKCVCGIPAITLEGTPEDWAKLGDKLAVLRGYGLDWWVDELVPICGQFVRASQGDVDTPFWQQIYKLTSRYGGEDVEGWVGKLFPYTKDWKTGTWTERNPLFDGEKITTECVPNGLTEAPVKLETRNGVTNIHFYAGFTGVVLDPTSQALRPRIGWAVCGEPEILALTAHLRADPRHSLRPAAGRNEPAPRVESLRELTRLTPIYECAPDMQEFYRAADGGSLFDGAVTLFPISAVMECIGFPIIGGPLGCARDGSRLFVRRTFGTVHRLVESPDYPLPSKIADSFTEFLAKLAGADGPLYWQNAEYPPIDGEELNSFRFRYHKPGLPGEELEEILARLYRQNGRHTLKLPRPDVLDARFAWLPPALRRFYQVTDGAALYRGTCDVFPLEKCEAEPGSEGRWCRFGRANDGSVLIMDVRYDRGIIAYPRDQGPRAGVTVSSSLHGFLKAMLESNGKLIWTYEKEQRYASVQSLFWPTEFVADFES
ncbi:MAG: DUF4419 domain-containing protein [Verrucomicrobiota bacterium]